MASRLDTFVTGPIPQPSGEKSITLHVRLRYNAPKHGMGTTMFENLDAELLTSTSKLLWRKHADNIWLVWKHFEIVGAYIDWLHDRILHRPELDGPVRPAEWTLMKYPKGKLREYSPLVQDMHTLVNMWLFGWYVEDETFMDTVMSTLQLLLEEEAHEPEYDDGVETSETFFRFLKPSVVTAIWANTAPGAKLRAFIVDYIMKYGSNLHVLRFNGTLVDRKDSRVEAAAPTPTKAHHSLGSFASPARSSPRRDTFALSTSGSDSDNTGKHDSTLQTYPADFITELNNAQRGTLLVSQLPEVIQMHYPYRVRVYLPPFPYVLPRTPIPRQYTPFEVDEAGVQYPQAITSRYDLQQDPVRSAFFEAVYGEGKTILRSAYWDAERDVLMELAGGDGGADMEMVDADGFADADAGEAKMSCVYHQHTRDRACWLLGHPLIHGGE
ncbi:hypothetical protein P171DRAFT_478889 [Karstenula rhodostoma CBS 690.94]|uniref:Uncharacterized protein n=1 Tax=Karstenula rhodostoma CBS 690.94 TaxID=1392251 RepID=A0A9P4UJM9_9PLEO|nr:hypothetical protein P171DRAFT_478889 [Karstenula rhodostoma CBS 690.94]